MKPIQQIELNNIEITPVHGKAGPLWRGLRGHSTLFRGLLGSLEKRSIGVKLKMTRSVLIFKKREVIGNKRKSKIF